MKRPITIVLAVSMMMILAGNMYAAVTQEEAKKLGTTLTMFGAEMAGNDDGSIPEYTGGLKTIPKDFKPGSGVRPDPFASEKPLFSINSKNMDSFSDKLTETTKALMVKHTDYRIDVYRTHRTVVFPKYVIDATLVNAVSAQTTHGGLSVQNATSGIPFPIPKDGFDVMWNHLLRYEGEAIETKNAAWIVNASGRRILSTEMLTNFEYPYFYKKNRVQIFFSWINSNLRVRRDVRAKDC